MLQGARSSEELRGGDEHEARLAWSRPVLPAPGHPVLLDLEGNFYTRCEPHEGRTRVGRMDYSEDAEIDDPERLERREPELLAVASQQQDIGSRKLPADDGVRA